VSEFWKDEVGASHEPLKVLIKRDAFTDPARADRRVPFKLYHPAESGGTKRPVIIWSHGLGGSRDGAGFLARYLAGNGFIVVNIQHRGTDTVLWEGMEGHPWDNIRKAKLGWDVVEARFKDVPFVLDQLPDWIEAQPDLSGTADFTRLGMSGHSFGATTTQIMAGQMLEDAESGFYSLKEDRFKAAIAYSPSPSSRHPAHEFPAVYSALTLPPLFMTGTADDSPISGADYHSRLPLFEAVGGTAQYLLVINGADHMIFSGSRGQLGEAAQRDLHENVIRLSSLCFWDAYLNENAEAMAWLRGGGLAAWINGNGFLKVR